MIRGMRTDMGSELYEKINILACETGFMTAHLDPAILEADPRVREMCADNKCRRYGTSWSCPPACGSIETLEKRMKKYTDGILLGSVIPVKSRYDMKAWKGGDDIHKKRFDTLVRQTKIFCSDIMPLAAGSCTRCAKCTYPDAPCRFPDKLYPSMEACGLFVSHICKQCGMQYNNGEGTITYFSAILF